MILILNLPTLKLSMEFSRQEHRNGLPFTSPGDLPNPGIEPGSPALQAPRGNPACRGTFGGRRKAVRDRLALQGGTGDLIIVV